MDALQIVKLAVDEVQFYGLPFVYGFDEVDTEIDRTNIISARTYVNKAYTEMCKAGFLQCFKNISILSGEREYRIANDYLSVYSARLIDGDTTSGTSYKMTATPIQVMDSMQSSFTYGNNKRPTAYAFLGSLLILDNTPDQDYTMRILVDVEPDPLLLETDIPSRLSTALHNVLSIGGSYYMSRLALNKEELRTQFNLSRHSEIKAEWNTGMGDVRRIASSRSLSNQSPANLVDSYH